MRSLLCIFTITLLCAVTFTGQSADTPIPAINPKFKVEIAVSCEENNTKAFIESHIKRELRSLQDVEIVNSGRYYLSIVAIELEYETSDRKTGGIVVARMFQRGYKPDTVLNKLMAAYPVNTKGYNELRDSGAILDLLSLHDKVHFGLNVSMRKDLDEICKEIVVRFDTQMLEPDRK